MGVKYMYQSLDLKLIAVLSGQTPLKSSALLPQANFVYIQEANMHETTTMIPSPPTRDERLDAPISTVSATRLHTSSLPSLPLNTMILRRSAST
jgi:hypothetical protein